MKRLLLLTAFALTVSGCSNKIDSVIAPEVQKACLKAVDFEGCVRAFTKPKEEKATLDFLGKPILEGWHMNEVKEDNAIWYHDIYNDDQEFIAEKIKVRGEYGRYIGYTVVKRWLQEPQAGRPGSSTQFGYPTTNCYGTGVGMNCTTIPAPTLNIPGKAAIPGGVRQVSSETIIDCLDRKWTIAENKRRMGWVSLDDYLSEDIADANCHRINELKPSHFKEWEKGRLNKKDKLAIQTLPGNRTIKKR